jgi:hypothetical protein
MRICFWATSFQADNQALAVHLSQQTGVEVLVALDEPERYQQEPVARLLPLRVRLLDRQAAATLGQIAAFAPDCVIVDNHLPKRRLARRLYVLWHGYGWRIDDLSTMKRELRKLVGDVQVPNADFRWQAFGELDRSYRVQHSGFAPENVVTLGSAYSDLLLPGSPTALKLDPRSVQSHYEIDLSRPTILLGMTWHHGGALGHWGDDAALHEELAQHAARLGANLLIRMHDRHRYTAPDAERMEALARRHSHVQLKFKSSHPDSLVDLLVSSVLVSNYSSLLNAFYHTGKPSIHIDPIAHDGPNFRRDWRWGMLRRKREQDPLASWKLSPEDIGGLRVQSFAELLGALSRAVAEPDCCIESSRAFARRHIALADGRALADGHSCERIATYLRRWLAE